MSRGGPCFARVGCGDRDGEGASTTWSGTRVDSSTDHTAPCACPVLPLEARLGSPVHLPAGSCSPFPGAPHGWRALLSGPPVALDTVLTDCPSPLGTLSWHQEGLAEGASGEVSPTSMWPRTGPPPGASPGPFRGRLGRGWVEGPHWCTLHSEQGCPRNRCPSAISRHGPERPLRPTPSAAGFTKCFPPSGLALV